MCKTFAKGLTELGETYGNDLEMFMLGAYHELG